MARFLTEEDRGDKRICEALMNAKNSLSLTQGDLPGADTMSSHNGSEKRRGARINKNFVVSYRIYGDPDNVDISQTRNMGEGGMLLTTNRAFDTDTILSIEIRLPLIATPIRLLGKILDSKEIARNLIYETRLSFTYIDEQSKQFVKDTVNYFTKKDYR